MNVQFRVPAETTIKSMLSGYRSRVKANGAGLVQRVNDGGKQKVMQIYQHAKATRQRKFPSKLFPGDSAPPDFVTRRHIDVQA